MKGIQDDQGVERRLGEKPRASRISPETLDVSDSDQTDLNLDSAAYPAVFPSARPSARPAPRPESSPSTLPIDCLDS